MCCTCFLYITNSLLPEVNEAERLIQPATQLMSASQWAESSFFWILLLVLTSSVMELLTCRHPAPFKVPLAKMCTRLAEITQDLWKFNLFGLATESQAVCPELFNIRYFCLGNWILFLVLSDGGRCQDTYIYRASTGGHWHSDVVIWDWILSLCNSGIRYACLGTWRCFGPVVHICLASRWCSRKAWAS